MGMLIEQDKWNQKGGLHYLIKESQGGGTNAIVRGLPDPLAQFVYHLAVEYGHADVHSLEKIKEIFGDSLKQEGSVPDTSQRICFGNDRVRAIRTLDNEWGIEGGPLYGSPNHLEIVHNEQGGGRWPLEGSRPPHYSGSRAELIYNVLAALENMPE
jgi:hypothetical protein